MTSHEHPNAKLAREGFEAFDRGDMSWMDPVLPAVLRTPP
jgi:ketosteroid isomerase-like protein